MINVKMICLTQISLLYFSEPLQQHLLPSAFESTQYYEKDSGARQSWKSRILLFANYVVVALVYADPQFTHL